MICFRCGSQVADTATECSNCGQDLGAPRRVTRTVTSFRALELRRKRASTVGDDRPYAVNDWIGDRYEISDLLGRGALGIVYRAVERETGLDVALKAMHPSLFANDLESQEFVDSFRRLGGHDAPDILRVVPVRDEERLLARSRFVPGLSLAKMVGLRKSSGQRFELHEIGPRIFQLVRALEQLHRTACHGFIKPSNVILEPDGVRVTDFGLMQALPVSAFVQAQEDAGAYVYLAPEIRDSNEPDARSDVYSIGVILYELLAGRPYAGKAPKLDQILGDDGDNRWRDVDGLLAQAMSLDPADRFQSISDFGDAFAVAIQAQAMISDRSHAGTDSTVRRAAKDVSASHLLAGGSSDETDSHAPLPLEIVDSQIIDEQSTDASFDEVDEDAILEVVDPESFDEPSVQLNFSVDDSDIFDEDLPTQVESRHVMEIDDSIQTQEPTMLASPSRAPWFLRSNAGFVVSIVAILGLVAAMVYYYINHRKDAVQTQSTAVSENSRTPDPDPTSPPVGPQRLPGSSTEQDVGKSNAGGQAELSEEQKDRVQEVGASAKSEFKEQSVASAAEVKKNKPKGDAVTKKTASNDTAGGLAKASDLKAKMAADEAKKAEAREKARLERVEAERLKAEKLEAKRLADVEAKRIKAEKREAERRAQVEAERLKAEAREAKRQARQQEREEERLAEEKRQADKREARKAAAAEKKRIQDERAAARAAERERRRAELEARRKDDADRIAAEEAKKKADAEERKAEAARRRQVEQDEKASAAAKKSTGTSKTELACPKGMRLMKTAKFPKGSTRRGKIKGEAAIALAKSGKAFCIDIYEYPGRRQKPRTNVNKVAAEGLCKRAGKRLCSDSEWKRGCRGRGGSAFPYGKQFRGGVCNTETEDGDEGVLKPAGKFRRCKSRAGLYDMSGNVAEWTADSTVRGGDFASSDEDAACNSGGRRSPGTARSSIGFRCCKSF